MAYDKLGVYLSVTREFDRDPRQSLQAIAARLGVHRHTASAAVASATGLGFRRWSRIRIVNMGKALLIADPDQSISGIASQLGFSSVQSFDKLFTRLTGKCPSLWRRCQTENTDR